MNEAGLTMHLTDCFIELVAYVVYFQKTVSYRQPSYGQVKSDIDRLIAVSEDCIKDKSFSQDDYNQAKFAICAWIDETILGSSWKEKGRWQGEQLQRVHFNTADAGVEFFERLNVLGNHQKEVREVYYLCLSLGFAGRYGDEKDAYLLEQLRTSNLKLLSGSSIGIPSLDVDDLFPEAYPAEAPGDRPGGRKLNLSIYTLLGLGGPVVLFVILLIIYTFILSGIGENFMRTVP
jgi:type VI secretion system protein ImpK